MSVENRTPIDLNVLRVFVGEDKVFEEHLLTKFVQTTSETVAAIQEAAGEGSAKQVSDFAHKIASSSRVVGAMDLTTACKELEQAGTQGDWSVINPMVQELNRLAQEVFDYLANR